jgi:plasmid recombination enzyme
MEKYRRADIVGIERENERNENYKSTRNPQIDKSRTHLNYHTIPFEKKYLSFIDERIKRLSPKRKIKDDAVLITSFILGSDKEFFDRITAEQQKQFFADCTDFFSERYGKENVVSAVVHLDESTPHLHFNLMPVTGGRLCAKILFDRTALRDLQTDFYEAVGKKYGLKRGKEGSTAKHLDTVAFKTKKMTEAAEEKIREAEEAQVAAKPVKELLESYQSAKSEKIPFSGKKKETEIIALRMKNSELEKQNNVLAKDNGDLYSELKRKEKTATVNEGAVKLLEKLLEYAPEELAAAQQAANRRQEQEWEKNRSRGNSNNKFKGK